MRRWGRLIELVIVILVALLCAFGLIYAYRVVCYEWGYCGNLGGTGFAGAHPELFKKCDVDLSRGGYPIRPMESHEFNVRFRRGSTALAVVRLSVSSLPLGANDEPEVTVWLVTPESELVNTRCPTCSMRLIRGTDGRYEGAVSARVPENGREDFRVFITNASTYSLRYCLKIDESVGRFEPDTSLQRPFS